MTINKLLKFSTLKRWLGEQPPNKTYDWSSLNGGCVFSRYMTAHGYDGNPHSGSQSFRLWSKLHDLYPGVLMNSDPSTEGYGCTYGKAFERALGMYG